MNFLEGANSNQSSENSEFEITIVDGSASRVNKEPKVTPFQVYQIKVQDQQPEYSPDVN